MQALKVAVAKFQACKVGGRLFYKRTLAIVKLISLKELCVRGTTHIL